MEPVLRLVPDKALAAFHHFVRNFLAAVRRQAVQDPCTGRGKAQERCIDRVLS